MDLLNLFGKENSNIWEICAPGIRSKIKMEQIIHDREDLNAVVNMIETAEICYTNRKMILSASKTLYGKTLQVSQTAKNALQIQSDTAQTNAQTTLAQINDQEAKSSQQINVQMFYQDVLSRYREALQGRYSEFAILDLLNQEMHEESTLIKRKLRECEAIIDGEDITLFDTIPFILHGEKAFQKRMCRISAKPIRKVVIVQELDNSKPIYYEWKNLQLALENDARPSRWPASLPFSRELIILDIEETKEVVNELKKTSSNPEFKKKAQEKHLEYKIWKEELEGVCKLIKADLALARASNC